MGTDGLDRYYTPDHVAQRCVQLLELAPGSRVLEPHVGAGAWVRALRAVVPDVFIVGMDLDPTAKGLQLVDVAIIGDFLLDDWRFDLLGRDLDAVVGNPPYSDAEAHVRRAFELTATTAYLLRATFLESRRRIPLLRNHPPARVHRFAERVRFLERGRPMKGGDSCGHALVTWRRGHTGFTPTLYGVSVLDDWPRGATP